MDQLLGTFPLAGTPAVLETVAGLGVVVLVVVVFGFGFGGGVTNKKSLSGL